MFGRCQKLGELEIRDLCLPPPPPAPTHWPVLSPEGCREQRREGLGDQGSRAASASVDHMTGLGRGDQMFSPQN